MPLTTKLRNAEVIEAMGLREGIRRRWLVEHEAEMSAQERANARNVQVRAPKGSVTVCKRSWSSSLTVSSSRPWK